VIPVKLVTQKKMEQRIEEQTVLVWSLIRMGEAIQQRYFFAVDLCANMRAQDGALTDEQRVDIARLRNYAEAEEIRRTVEREAREAERRAVQERERAFRAKEAARLKAQDAEVDGVCERLYDNVEDLTDGDTGCCCGDTGDVDIAYVYGASAVLGLIGMAEAIGAQSIDSASWCAHCAAELRYGPDVYRCRSHGAPS